MVSRFSDRIGARQATKSVQIDGMDAPLRNSLWNAIRSRVDTYPSHWHQAASGVARHALKVPVDSFHSSENGSQEWLRTSFFAAPWYAVYDIVEFVVLHIDRILEIDRRYGQSQRADFIREVDGILELELSGYRFIGGQVVPISDPVEVAAIEASASCGGGPSEHIRTALALLGQRPNPDYRNSIKESVSAVESVVNAYAGTDANGVAKAVEALAKKVEIHPALRAAVKQLYGYSSDANGVRHAILDQATIGYAEAAFMLVACSAFVNFFTEKVREASVHRGT